jgi:uncharacterized peroxidase-related enzyme
MAHIKLGNDYPGILGPMHYRPETARPLNALAETILRGPSSLTRAERETIATYVSHLNGCHFCMRSHRAVARHHYGQAADTVDAVLKDPSTAPVSAKMKALLAIAAKVQKDARTVAAGDADAARAQGATDQEIHDAVLVAAAFCMFNRYVDGLGTFAPPADSPAYPEMGAMLAEKGYVGAV